MICIPEIERTDKGLIALVIFSIVLTSFAWIGDIASWIYIGNGFQIDIILLVVAIALTIWTILIRNRVKKISEPQEEIDEELKELISEGATTIEIAKKAKENGMKTLRESGMEKAVDGVTSLEEVLRVTLI